MLALIVGQKTPSNLHLHLYANPADLTQGFNLVELVGEGYAPKVLPGSKWGIVKGVPVLATAPEQTWTFVKPPPSEWIYGYYVTRGNTIVWAEAFSAPISLAQRKQIRVTARLALVGVEDAQALETV